LVRQVREAPFSASDVAIIRDRRLVAYTEVEVGLFDGFSSAAVIFSSLSRIRTFAIVPVNLKGTW